MASHGPSDDFSSSPLPKGSPEPRRSNRTKPTTAIVSAPVRRRVKDRWFFEPVPLVNPILGGELSSSNQGVFLAQKSSEIFSGTNQDSPCDPNEVMKSFVDTNGDEAWATPRSLIFGNTVRDDASSAMAALTMQPEAARPIEFSSSETITRVRKVLLPAYSPQDIGGQRNSFQVRHFRTSQ
jgi:hypothetical protein